MSTTVSNYDRLTLGEILNGHGTWFSAQLFRLIQVADARNRELLRIAYPDHVAVYEEWLAGGGQ